MAPALRPTTSEQAITIVPIVVKSTETAERQTQMKTREEILKTKPSDINEKFMLAAIKEAYKAYDLEECPIGCVVVKDGKIISRAHNLRIKKQCATAHAEILAIQKACRKLDSWRLPDCDLYVTLEPCTMCSGAIIQARIRNVFFGAYEPKGGAVCSCNDIFDIRHGHNHKVEYTGGILKDQCSDMLKTFFREVRENKSKVKDRS